MSEANVAAPAASVAAAPAAVVAPAAAPAAAPADISIPGPDAAPATTEPVKVEPAASAVIQYEKTGDPGLDMALDFVGQRGFDDAHPAMQAAVNGDFTLLEAALAALGDKAAGYQNIVALAKKSFDESSSKAKTKAEADTKLVHDAVGGKEQWEKITAWAKTAAEPAEREQVNAALKQGGLVAKVMAQWLGNAFAKAAGTVVEPASVVTPGAAAKPDTPGPLTAVQYAKEVQELRTKLGHGFERSNDYRALQQRRLVARTSGR